MTEKQIAPQHFLFLKMRSFLCPDFYTGHFRLENKLKMFFSENEPQINADERLWLFTAHFQLVLDRTKLIPSFRRIKLKLPCQSVFTKNQPPKSYISLPKQAATDVSEMKTSVLGWFTKILVFMHSEQCL
jgi:hypothetical protein